MAEECSSCSSKKPKSEDRLEHLIENNKRWSEAIKQEDPTFFERLAQKQEPEILWIGCADSRVPSNKITGLEPGQVFVHRNIANLVLHSDLNVLSVMQYAIQYLKVKHVIVCGHYGCGGVAAAYDEKDLGMIVHWLGAIKDIMHLNRAEIEALPDREARIDRLCELNVKAQVSRVARTPIVQEAWQRGQKLTIHGWIYGLKDGLIQDLDANITGPHQVDKAYRLEYG